LQQNNRALHADDPRGALTAAVRAEANLHVHGAGTRAAPDAKGDGQEPTIGGGLSKLGSSQPFFLPTFNFERLPLPALYSGRVVQGSSGES
jgi:hypothetical protein